MCVLGMKVDSRFPWGVPAVVQWLTNPTRNHEVAGSIPGLLSGLRIRHCRELWCRLQTRLASHDWTPSLETSICHGSGPRKGKKTKKKKKKVSLGLSQGLSFLFSISLRSHFPPTYTELPFLNTQLSPPAHVTSLKCYCPRTMTGTFHNRSRS